MCSFLSQSDTGEESDEPDVLIFIRQVATIGAASLEKKKNRSSLSSQTNPALAQSPGGERL